MFLYNDPLVLVFINIKCIYYIIFLKFESIKAIIKVDFLVILKIS